MPLKNLLIFAWEYPGVNSKGGTALARRIGQVAEAFANNGWNVSVIHYDHLSENHSEGNHVIQYKTETGSILRYPVKNVSINSIERNQFMLTRKISTVFHAYFHGDRSYRWGLEAAKLATSYPFKPDLILSFFTPRGPLLAGKITSNFYQVPWFSDFQDTYDEGSMGFLKPFVRSWTKRILKSASQAIHVSPEWAERDSKELNIPFVTIRHAIPNLKHDLVKYDSRPKDDFTIFYGGSLDFTHQSPELLIKAINQLRSESSVKIKINLAASETVYKGFLKFEGADQIVNWLGWISKEELNEKIDGSDCLLIIGWRSQNRQVVPSKLYEYLSYNKPVLIAGEDSGGLISLLKECNHPDVICNTIPKIKTSLTKALREDFTDMFVIEKSKNEMVHERDLYLYFNNLIKGLSDPKF